MATCKEEIHLGDIGTVFKIALTESCINAVDLTDFVAIEILFLKPSGATLTRTATVSGGVTAGVIQYVTIAGDLDEVGSWKIQGRVALPNGDWKSVIQKFKVKSNIV